MARSEGAIGYGVTVYLGDGGSPETYLEVGEVYDVGPIGATKSQVDFTHHKSPNAYKEFKNGLAEGEEVEFRCNRVVDETGQDAVRTRFTNDTEITVQVASPGNAEGVSFPATILSHMWETPIEDRQTFRFTAKIAGDPTFTAPFVPPA